jgi:hypothetical protein
MLSVDLSSAQSTDFRRVRHAPEMMDILVAVMVVTGFFFAHWLAAVRNAYISRVIGVSRLEE